MLRVTGKSIIPMVPRNRDLIGMSIHREVNSRTSSGTTNGVYSAERTLTEMLRVMLLWDRQSTMPEEALDG